MRCVVCGGVCGLPEGVVGDELEMVESLSRDRACTVSLLEYPLFDAVSVVRMACIEDDGVGHELPAHRAHVGLRGDRVGWRSGYFHAATCTILSDLRAVLWLR